MYIETCSYFEDVVKQETTSDGSVKDEESSTRLVHTVKLDDVKWEIKIFAIISYRNKMYIEPEYMLYELMAWYSIKSWNVWFTMDQF